MEKGTVSLGDSTLGGSFKNPEYDCCRELNLLINFYLEMKVPARLKFMSFGHHIRRVEMVQGELKNAYEVILDHVHNHSHEEIKGMVLEAEKLYPPHIYELAMVERKIKTLESKVKLLQLQVIRLEGRTDRD
jgi:hypothetical protein